jgi:hypothetical protein
MQKYETSFEYLRFVVFRSVKEIHTLRLISAKNNKLSTVLQCVISDYRTKIPMDE